MTKSIEPTKNILVCLDHTTMNESVLKYTSFIVNDSQVEKVNFINAVKNLDIPSEVMKEFPDLKKNALKERKDKIIKDVERWFVVNRKVKISYTIKSGREAKTILDVAEKDHTDLIIIGRKSKTESEGGILAPRLARRAGCSLLIVPEDTVPKINKMLLPIDFSVYSKLAVQRAVEIANSINNHVEIVAQNVYTVPTGYHYSGKSYEDFAEIMKKHAQDDYKKFMAGIDTKDTVIKPMFNLDINDNLISDIVDMAGVIHPDCIVIGAKGRTAASALFLGSFAEKLIHAEMPYPLLIIRPKGQKEGFIDYLKEISK